MLNNRKMLIYGEYRKKYYVYVDSTIPLFPSALLCAASLHKYFMHLNKGFSPSCLMFTASISSRERKKKRLYD